MLTPTPFLEGSKLDSVVLINHYTINLLKIQFQNFDLYIFFQSFKSISIMENVDVPS